jgi:hypothetical protein
MDFQNIDVFILAGGKCGSSTLLETFKNLGYKSIKCHNHWDFIIQYGYDGLLKSIKDSSSNKKVYIIDSYRTPIERKISSFFEHIQETNKNFEDENIFDLIEYFNKEKLNTIEEYHYINQFFSFFKIDDLKKNDFKDNMYYFKEVNNFIIIKLLFKNVNKWDEILSDILKKKVLIQKSNITEDKKEIKYIYKKFKDNYRPPLSYIKQLKEDKYLNFFLDEKEVQEYINHHFYDKH